MNKELPQEELDEESSLDPKNWLEFFGDQLFRYTVIRVGDIGVAEDIVQEAMLGAIKSKNLFDGKSSIKTWLFAILKNKIKDYFATKHRGSAVNVSGDSEDADLDLASLLRPEIENEHFQTAIEREEFWLAIENCGSKMPAHYKEAFRARLEDDEATVEALSEQLGISDTNFNVRLFRARLLMRKCLEMLWLGKQ